MFLQKPTHNARKRWGEDIFRVPITYILIPRSCINPSLLSSNCPDYLSSSSFQCLIVIFYVALICSLCECKRKLCNLVSKDSMGWTDRCTSLWWRKANVCSATRDLLAKSCAAMEAFKLSVVDAAKQKRSQLKNFVSMRSRIEQASNGLFASKKVLVAFGHCGILGGTNKKLGSLSSFVMRPWSKSTLEVSEVAQRVPMALSSSTSSLKEQFKWWHQGTHSSDWNEVAVCDTFPGPPRSSWGCLCPYNCWRKRCSGVHCAPIAYWKLGFHPRKLLGHVCVIWEDGSSSTTIASHRTNLEAPLGN